MNCACYVHAGHISRPSLPEAMTYAGLIYYEEDGVEDIATFTAAKNLNALLKVRDLLKPFQWKVLLSCSLLKTSIVKQRLDQI